MNNELTKIKNTSNNNFKNILLDQIDQGIYRLAINRPEALNALNEYTLNELHQAIDTLKNDSCVRALLITGAGNKAFVAGADIEHMSKLSPVEAKAFSEYGLRIFHSLETLRFPVIALVNGYALGGGCELAMSCDFIIASENACFGQPEVNLGITAGFGGTQRLTRLLGRAMAMELLVTGRTMSAEEALQRGLVNHIYPLTELEKNGLKLASIIARKSSHAVHLTKQLVQYGQNMDLLNACIMESEAFGLSFSTDESREGMSAFLERRKPVFTQS